MKEMKRYFWQTCWQHTYIPPFNKWQVRSITEWLWTWRWTISLMLELSVVGLLRRWELVRDCALDRWTGRKAAALPGPIGARPALPMANNRPRDIQPGPRPIREGGSWWFPAVRISATVNLGAKIWRRQLLMNQRYFALIIDLKLAF